MNRLDTIKTALTALTEATYHYHAPPNSAAPYIVWAEDNANDFEANNLHAESADQGTIDLYTKQENDPLMASIPEALNSIECAWYKNSTQYEEDTGLIHVEWVFEV